MAAIAISKKAKVYINGRLIGFHANPEKLVADLREKRRQGKIAPQANIALQEDTNEVFVNTDSGRVQRPLVVVENGKAKLTDEMIKQVGDGKLTWSDLLAKGIIEFVDADEEENTLVAAVPEEITKEHTHLEIDPVGTLSVITSMIPYLQHNMAGKVLHGAKMFKQAQGIAAINHNLRTDTESFFLHYPEKALVKTKTMDILNFNKRPQAQNFVVAILPWYGFNILDAVIVNKGAIDRALARSSYFRIYNSVENRYPGGQVDKFERPDEETVGYLGEETYVHLGEDGMAHIEAPIEENEAIVGKTSPPRFLEEVSEFGVVKEKRRESSTTLRKGKNGVIDRIMLTEGDAGHKVVKIKVRSSMIPEIGDKFSSRHGQKGVVGAIVPEEDMPFTADGIKPDLILNPHSIPSRMTIGHLIEMLAGKAAAMKGEVIDGSPFDEVSKDELGKMLHERGLRNDGKEVFYDGLTGERIDGEIFTGVVAYRRLFHMVRHKIQARSRGPVQILTRQPTEGKEKEGGLRFGEMEGEALVGHGAAMLLQEKFIDDSDKAVQLVCEKCGIIAMNDLIRKKRTCLMCGSSKVYPVEMSYGFKLLLDELKALGIYPKLVIKDKV